MTNFAISLLASIPVRNEPKEQAEQITQLLFGDLVYIETEIDKWAKIKIISDNQIGWADKKILIPLNQNEYDILSSDKTYAYTNTPFSYIEWNNGLRQPVSLASKLYNYNNGLFSIGKKIGFVKKENVLTQPLSLEENNLKLICNPLIGIPYLWGGKNCFGFDCSGFTQVVMLLFNISLKRNANEQAQQGTTIQSLSNIQSGDLLFFGNNETDITHVGIALNKNKIIHCSGQVKIDTLTINGIETQIDNHTILSHHLVKIQRVT